jgi:hypothetical protein
MPPSDQAITAFYQLFDLFPIQAACDLHRDPAVLSDVRCFDETRVLKEDPLLGLGDLYRDRVSAVRPVKHAKWLSFEPEKRMAEVLGLLSAGERETDFSKARKNSCHLSFFREALDPAARVLGHASKCIGVDAGLQR